MVGELLADLGWEGLEPSHRFISRYAVRPRLFDLPLKALMGTCFPVGPCVGETVHGWNSVSVTDCLEIYSWTKFGRLASRGARLWLRGAGLGSQATSRSKAETKVCRSII